MLIVGKKLPFLDIAISLQIFAESHVPFLLRALIMLLLAPLF